MYACGMLAGGMLAGGWYRASGHSSALAVLLRALAWIEAARRSAGESPGRLAMTSAATSVMALAQTSWVCR